MIMIMPVAMRMMVLKVVDPSIRFSDAIDVRFEAMSLAWIGVAVMGVVIMAVVMTMMVPAPF